MLLINSATPVECNGLVGNWQVWEGREVGLSAEEIGNKKKRERGNQKMRHNRVRVISVSCGSKFESVVPYLQTFQLFCRQSHANVHPGSFHCNGVKETSTMRKRVKSGGE